MYGLLIKGGMQCALQGPSLSVEFLQWLAFMVAQTESDLRTHTNERTITRSGEGKIAYFAKILASFRGEAHKKPFEPAEVGVWGLEATAEKFSFYQIRTFLMSLFPICRIFAMAAAEKGLKNVEYVFSCRMECGWLSVCLCACTRACLYI